jgi:hypothetical protein
MRASKILLIFLVFCLSLGLTTQAFAAEKTVKLQKKITSGTNADVYLGRGGVFFSNSVFSGVAQVTRMDPDQSHSSGKLRFFPRWLDARLYVDNEEIKQARGLVYVYFNLDNQLRKAWDDGKLHIYQYVQKTGKWEMCQVELLVKTKYVPQGRLACVISNFGLYGMAFTQ